MREAITKTLRARLFIYYLVPVAVLLTGSCWYFYVSAKKSLDHEMNTRLIQLGQTLSQQIDPLQLMVMMNQNETSKTRLRLKKKFSQIAKVNHLSYVFMIDEQHQSMVDSRANYPMGLQYADLDIFKQQVQIAFSGSANSENVFLSDQRYAQKKAFVPVYLKDKVEAVIVLQADAMFFSSLDILKRNLSYFACLCLLLIVLISFVISSGIVKPIEQLVRQSKEIGEGILTKPIKVDADGELNYLAHALEDMRQKIKRRDDERDMMLKGIAHEIKNPIGGIDLYVDILSQSIDDEKNKKSLQRISHETAMLKNVVEEFLDFARGIVLDVQSHDVDTFLNHGIEMFEKERVERNIEFAFKPQKKQADFDGYYMKRVLSNVFRNALDAVEADSGSINISYDFDKKKGLHMCIEDNGEGILKQHMHDIYKPFYTSKPKGMGLGLAFCKKIIEKHKGQFEIQSGFGQGTRVHLWIPQHG